MKFRMPSRWRKLKKAKTAARTPLNPVTTNPQKSRISHLDHVQQAIENVRSSQAPPGEVYALTILEENEELVGWMNFCNYKMSSAASSVRRNAMADGFGDWRSAEVAVLEGGDVVDGERQEFRSATSASTMGTNTSEAIKFGKSGIEIPGCGRRRIQGAQVQVNFRAIDWNPLPILRLEDADGIGPAGEIADYEL